MTDTDDFGSNSSPAMALKQADPPDDTGAETFDRYEWQAVMAAADLLAGCLDHLDKHAKPIPDITFEMICEHHEDWALTDGREAEIVSAKHKETEAGAFTTVRGLLVDGGVLHLLDRWLALGRGPRCRLVTTAGLAADARALMDAADALAAGTPDGAEYDAVLERFAAAIGRARAAHASTATEKDSGGTASVPIENRTTLVAFLKVLRIQDSMPARAYADPVAVQHFARPVAEKLGAPEEAAAIWTAVLGLVRERMRAAGPTRRGQLPAVLGAADKPGRESRMITLADVALAIRWAIHNPSGFRPLPRRIRTGRVAIKMVAGGCTDNSIERAELLRRQYRQHWRDARQVPGAAPALQRVENTLMRVIDKATEKVVDEDETWGRALWRELQARLDEIATGDEVGALDADLLLGGVSELTSRCRAWFSVAFDVEAEAQRLAEMAATARGTTSHSEASTGGGP